MSLSLPKFTKINESFVCINCKKTVDPSSSTCRDHCPFCLHSLHVDNNPGDRDAQCGGILKPVGYVSHKKKGYVIQFRCLQCGMERRNRFLEIDNICPDSLEALLALTPRD